MEHQLESGPFKRGRGGRPNREEAERRHRGLLDAARRLLLAKGWDGASIDEISRQSGVAKRFIYSRYPDKAALFVGAILHYRLNQIGEIHLPDPMPADVEDRPGAEARRKGQAVADIPQPRAAAWRTLGLSSFCFSTSRRAVTDTTAGKRQARRRSMAAVDRCAGRC